MNIELLREAVEWVEKEAEKGDASAWDQGVWASTGRGTYATEDEAMEHTCGTKACVAGHLAITHGMTISWVKKETGGEWYRDIDVNQRKAVEAFGHAPDCGSLDGRPPEWNEDSSKWSHYCWTWSSLAARILDLPFEEVAFLFNGGNTLQQVRDFAQRIAASHGEEL